MSKSLFLMHCNLYWWYLYWYWWHWHDGTGVGTEGTDSTSTDGNDIGTILSHFHWWILRLSAILEKQFHTFKHTLVLKGHLPDLSGTQRSEGTKVSTWVKLNQIQHENECFYVIIVCYSHSNEIQKSTLMLSSFWSSWWGLQPVMQHCSLWQIQKSANQ